MLQLHKLHVPTVQHCLGFAELVGGLAAPHAAATATVEGNNVFPRVVLTVLAVSTKIQMQMN